MKKALKNFAYIDNTNLYKGCESEGFKIDYKKFLIYLTEKLAVKTAYIFIGFLSSNKKLYEKFREWGYIVIFKQTIITENGAIKGNCDAELVLQAVSDFYEKKFEKSIVVTSDGDFACLVTFLSKNNAIERILSPRNINKCSSLLRESGAKLTFLPEVMNQMKYPE